MTVDTEVTYHAPTQTIVTVTRPPTQTITVTETETVTVQETVLGVPGPDGRTAYQVAVDNGFMGSVDDWLDTLVGPQGEQGIQGVKGDQGVPGTPGTQGDLGGIYEYSQGQSMSVWTINHNLGYHPNVTTVDSANTRIEGDVDYPDINTVTVTFSVAIGGRAYLS